MKKYLFVLLLLIPTLLVADNTKMKPSLEAKQLFKNTYDNVFGKEGCSLHYEVNLVGLYKTSGTIWYKGNKSKFIDSKVDSWNDGQTVYTVYRKKKNIEIYDAHSDKRDKYASKFKFTLDDFDYEILKRSSGYVLLKLKQRKDAKGTIKEAKVLIEENTLTPIQAKIKVAFFWATINISDFKAGNIDEQIFVFPKANYGKDYKYIDKR